MLHSLTLTAPGLSVLAQGGLIEQLIDKSETKEHLTPPPRLLLDTPTHAERDFLTTAQPLLLTLFHIIIFLAFLRCCPSPSHPRNCTGSSSARRPAGVFVRAPSAQLHAQRELASPACLLSAQACTAFALRRARTSKQSGKACAFRKPRATLRASLLQPRALFASLLRHCILLSRLSAPAIRRSSGILSLRSHAFWRHIRASELDTQLHATKAVHGITLLA